MLRDILGLTCGGLAGMLIGAIAGYVWSGLMGSSMLGLAGLLPGAFIGWRLSLMFPARPTDQNLLADYDDGPTASDQAPTHF